MKVVVTGIGLYSSLGNLERTWTGLLRGETGIKTARPFPDLPPVPLGLIGDKPADFEDLTRGTLEDALKDAGLSPPLADCSISIGSSRGCQGILEAMAAGKITPDRFIRIFSDRASPLAVEYSRTLAPVSAPMAACVTGIHCLARGFDSIYYGESELAIAGAVETPITPLTLIGFERMGALASTGCYPFDREREGLVLGEGAAIFVLESERSALERGAFIYGRILGYGLTCDAYHVSAPATSNFSAALAIKSALDRSDSRPDQIDYIHAHGTSTRLNDEREAHLISTLFPAGIPVSSTKGATGHTLGASGALGAAFCLKALETGVIPPCTGSRESDFKLNLVRGAVSYPLNRVLCTGFGFGGQNGAIVFARYLPTDQG